MSELEALRMRDEVLQAMFWMHAEGLGSTPGAAELARVLAVDEAQLQPWLERFVEEGLIRRSGAGFAMSEGGLTHGRTSFAEEFAHLTKPGHGQCAADCWCHDSIEAAKQCHDERAHSHSHD